MRRAARVRVSLGNLRRNCALLRRRAPGSSLLAVLKADAYGHGAAACARALEGLADAVAVATVGEARELRESGVTLPLLALHGANSGAELAAALAARIDLAVHDPAQAALLEEARPGGPGPALWLMADTGMNRLGVAPAALPGCRERLAALPWLRGPPVLMTHLSCADEADDPETARQLARFAALPGPGPRSAANSAAVLRYPESHLDWIRPGLALYGVAPGPAPEPELRPAMRLTAPLLAVRDCPAGAKVGYGAAHVCKEPTRVGIVAAGYADGYPRAAGGRAAVGVAGRRAAVLGRVSMDLTAVDLTGLDAAPGDEAELWGPAAPAAVTAAAAGTIPYELLCRAGGLPREHVE